ncbi:helix-turn-helix domain-containing protein [Actinomycetospora sp. CA-101289]|uniref:helix-turn-helix domain-containing protein n=1 Tax=Actinomycetospora sp. CA-101289 TaxID=3239893 RepID=UPI003D986C06
MPEERRLLSTGEAARHVGVDRSTLGRWVAAGLITPTRRTVGGQYRWDLEELDAQLQDLEQRGADQPPFARELADAPRHPEEPS